MARARAIALVFLIGAACLDKSMPVTSATSTGAEAESTSSSDDPTGTSTGWFEVACTDATCTKNQICVHPVPDCVVIQADPCSTGGSPDPSGGSSGGDATDSSGGEPEPETEPCFVEESRPPECRAIPLECKNHPNFELCVGEKLCYGGDFDDKGALHCSHVFDHCLEGEPPYDYCYC